MKKLLKSEICGSINSAQKHCSLRKVNICSYYSLNSSRIPPKCMKKKKKKKKKNENAACHKRRRNFSESKRTLKAKPNEHLCPYNINKMKSEMFIIFL